MYFVKSKKTFSVIIKPMDEMELSQKEAELILEKQNEYFNSQATKDVDFRIAQLKLLKSSIKRYEEQIVEALKKDLGKHKCESYATEIGFVYNSISCIIRNLRRWMRPQKKRTPLFLMPGFKFMYPPFTEKNLNIIKWFLR